MSTIDLSRISKDDVYLVGGKGASLGELIKTGIRVPPGFVITTRAYENFIDNNKLREKIKTIIKINEKDENNVKLASQKIGELINDAEMCPSIANSILKGFCNMGMNYVAIRSSATAEDALNAAWEGQFESYLNVTEKNLLGYVKKCWASLFTPSIVDSVVKTEIKLF